MSAMAASPHEIRLHDEIGRRVAAREAVSRASIAAKSYRKNGSIGMYDSPAPARTTRRCVPNGFQAKPSRGPQSFLLDVNIGWPLLMNGPNGFEVETFNMPVSGVKYSYRRPTLINRERFTRQSSCRKKP